MKKIRMMIIKYGTKVIIKMTKHGFIPERKAMLYMKNWTYFWGKQRG